MAMKYPDRTKPSKRMKAVKAKKITVPGEAMTIDEAIGTHARFSPYIAQNAIYFHPDLNEITEDQFDMPDAEKFSRLDPTEQVQVQQNINGLKEHFNRLIEIRKSEYQQALDAQKSSPEEAPKVEEEKS